MAQHYNTTVDAHETRQRGRADRDRRIDGHARRAQTAGRPVVKSLQEYGRGLAGGLLFSLPMLYTMEIWWAGFVLHSWRLVVYVIATFILLLGYNRYAGLRRDASFTEVAIDSVEELGLGLFIAAVTLWLLGRVTSDMQASEILGQVVTEAMTVAIGVSVGTAQLGGGDDSEDTGMSGDGQGENAGLPGESAAQEVDFAGQLVLALCGAVLIAANVAPTEEIVMIAAEISAWKVISLALVSIALGALILFFSDFRGARPLAQSEGWFSIISGSAITYAVALLVSAMILWFFGRFDGAAPVTCLAQTIVLGVAAVLGASAGRFLLQTNSKTYRL